MTELYARGNTDNGVTQLTRSVNISIANIFSKINPSDKSFLKYIPDGILSDEQLKKNNQVMTEEEMKKKGFSQRGSGNKVPSHLNESPFFEDILAPKTDSVKEENKINQITNPLAKLTLPTDAEKVSIVAIYKVIKQGIQMGEHGNQPSLSAKKTEGAHKE